MGQIDLNKYIEYAILCMEAEGLASDRPSVVKYTSPQYPRDTKEDYPLKQKGV